MKYMLLVYGTERDWDEPYREACYAESRELVQDIKARGQFLATSPLYPSPTAASVRVRDGKRLVTDGPFAETHEQLGGYYIVDVESQDEAIEIAARIPGARNGTIEVRQVIELAGIPKD